MACDIRSKSGLGIHMGYGTFHFMRSECLEQMHKGFGNFYKWATLGDGGVLPGIERDWSDGGGTLNLPWKSGCMYFSMACRELLGTWLKANGLGFAWRHFFCHSDCDGGWTAKQCKRLIKYLEKIDPGERGKDAFNAFKEIVREAANRNE